MAQTEHKPSAFRSAGSQKGLLPQFREAFLPMTTDHLNDTLFG